MSQAIVRGAVQASGWVWENLPDMAGILFAGAALGVALMPPSGLERLGKQRGLRWFLAILCTLIGLGGWISNGQQKKRSAQNQALQLSQLSDKLDQLGNQIINPRSPVQKTEAAKNPRNVTPMRHERIFPEPAERGDLHFESARISLSPDIRAHITMRNVGRYSVRRGLMIPTVFISHPLSIAEEDAFFEPKNFAQKGSGVESLGMNWVIPGDTLTFDRGIPWFDPEDLQGLAFKRGDNRKRLLYVTTWAFFEDKLGPLKTESCAYYQSDDDFAVEHPCFDHNH